MKKFYLRNVIVGLSFIVVLCSAIMNQSGPGGGYSGAPSESSCASSCHGSGLITSGNSNLNNFRLKGNFTGNGYIPDSVYTIEVTFKQSGISKWGFQVTCLDKNNLPAGTLTNTNSRTSKVTFMVGSNTRQYIQHTSTGTSSVGTDSTRWTFSWTAPSNNIGNVKFYVVVNAANGNNQADGGDAIYGKQFTIAPSSLLPTVNVTSPDSVTCTGYNVQLNSNATNNPTTYTWKLLGGTPSASSLANPVVTYSTSGTKQAILTVKNNKGSSLPDTLNIVVSNSPAATINGNSSGATICQGDSILLSANTGTSITYQWLNLNKTSRTIYVKDSGNYFVKVTSTTTGCSRTSPAFKLVVLPKPTVSLSRVATNDTFCTFYNEVLTASGTDIDSVHWYINGVLTYRTKSLTMSFGGTSNAVIHAIAKSAGGCRSIASNTIKFVVKNKLYPSAISFSKTTSTIDLKWKKTNGISSFTYSTDGSNYFATTTDSTLKLTGLTPNTTYNIRIRSAQSAPCLSSDTTINITTNACSNLSYTLNFNNRTCFGNSLNMAVKGLYSSKYSISFNGAAFSKDTFYSFIPVTNDTLRIQIIDSLSPTCPPIKENLAYIVDTPVDTDTASTQKNISSCLNVYTMRLPSGYSLYEYYKNNLKINSSATDSFVFTGLITGDKLHGVGIKNSCSKQYGPVNITVQPKPVSTFTFTRNWKDYTFTADNTGNASYLWTTGTDILGTTAVFTKNMSAYNNSSIAVKLICSSSASCVDSSTVNINVPDLTSVNKISAGNFNIYPNPFSDKITIESTGEPYTVTVYDLQGKIIYSKEVKEGLFEIMTETWAAGVYHVSVKGTQTPVLNVSFIKS